MVWYGNKYEGECKSSGTMAVLESLYPMLRVKHNNSHESSKCGWFCEKKTEKRK